MKIENLTWKEVEQLDKSNVIAVIPIGALENHGPQGPLGTDFLIPTYLSDRIDNDDVMIYPTIPYGISPHHEDYPGTINIDYDVLYPLMHRVLSGIVSTGFEKVLVINGHGGNSPAIERAALEINSDLDSLIAIIDWWSSVAEVDSKFKGGHGGGQESSAMLYINKDTVKLEKLFDQKVIKLSENLEYKNTSALSFRGGTVKLPRNMRKVVETGWYGPDDPADASYEYGEEMLEMYVEYLKDFLEEFAKINEW